MRTNTKPELRLPCKRKTVPDKDYLFSLNNSCDTNPIHEELSSYSSSGICPRAKSESILSRSEIEEFRDMVSWRNT